MITNCFIKELKGSFDNSNLKKLGTLSFTWVSDGTKYLQIGLDKGAVLKCTNGTFSVYGTEYTNVSEYTKDSVASASTILVPSGAGNWNFEVSVYNIFRFTGYGSSGTDYSKIIVPDVSELNYIGTILESSSSKMFKVDSAQFSGYLNCEDSNFWNLLSGITIINDNTGDFYFDFSGIHSDTLTNITVQNNYAEFNINNVYAPNLTTLGLYRSYNILGDLKTWANTMWASGAGRTSGSVRVITTSQDWSATRLTWDGTPINQKISGTSNPYILFHQNEAPTLSATNS